MLTRQMQRPTAIVLGSIGALLVIFGLVYLTVKAGQLPGFFPGHITRVPGKHGHVAPTHAHVKIGVLLFVAAIGAFVGAWWIAFRYEPVD